MDVIDEANRAAYRETKYLIQKAREANEKQKLHPIGVCHHCRAPIKKKAKNTLFCDSDCRDDYTYFQERKKANGRK